MEPKIQKQIIDYFSFFEEFFNKTKTYLKDCQKCAASINKHIIRCRKIKEAEINDTPLGKFPGIQNRLCARFYLIISEDILDIKNYLSTLDELFEKLCNKHKVLRESCKDVNFAEQSILVKGTSLQPSLAKLLEFSDYTLNFASQICAQIESSLNILSIKKFDTDSLIDCFKISSEWQQRIPEIIAYTSFVTENQV